MWTQKEQNFLDRYEDEIEEVKLDTLFDLLEKAGVEVGEEFYYKLAFALSYLLGGPKVFRKKVVSVSKDNKWITVSFFIDLKGKQIRLARFSVKANSKFKEWDTSIIERLSPEIEFKEPLKEVVSSIEWR